MSTIINKRAPISDHANLYVTEVQITAMVATTSLPNPLQFDEFLSVAWYSHRQFGFDDWAFLFFSLSLLLEVALRFLRPFSPLNDFDANWC